MTLWVGLSGGIGSGKSAVAQRFGQYGVPIIDADAIARTLTAPGGAALPTIRRIWGNDLFLPNHHLNRNRLREMVFNQPGEKHKLEALLHPLILQHIQTQQKTLQPSQGYGIVDIPLLVEQPTFQTLVQRILIVDAPEAERIARVQARNGLDETAVRAIMTQQCNREARLAIADDVVDNSQHWQHLDDQVARLHRFYQALSRPQP